MMFYPLGLMIAITCLLASAHHLNQPLSSYSDYVAFVMVIGGTVATGVITLPWNYGREVWNALLVLFVRPRGNHREIALAGIDLARTGGVGFKVKHKVTGLPAEVLNEGAELLLLGLETKKVETILRERIFQSVKRTRRIGQAVRGLAKYPPGFGLMGTVLGLVNLMRGLANGLDAKGTGLEMAVALVATFYGLILSNLVINPAGELIVKKASEEEEEGEIALQAVLLAADHTSLLEAQEMLNSYLNKDQRLSVLGFDGPEKEAA